MPTYEYQCKKCEHKLEQIQKITDKPLTKCPSCNKKALERILSPSGFILKGRGWFKSGGY